MFSWDNLFWLTHNQFLDLILDLDKMGPLKLLVTTSEMYYSLESKYNQSGYIKSYIKETTSCAEVWSPSAINDYCIGPNKCTF